MLSTSQTPPALYSGSGKEHGAKLLTLIHQLRESHLTLKGQDDTDEHLQAISEAVIRGTAPTYFGFVTGGVTPVAARADNIVTEIDANVSVHLPDVSIATEVEDACLRWLLELVKLDASKWKHRTLTTGATASNILGLACARDYVVREAARRKGLGDINVAELGFHRALQAIGAKDVQILTPTPHSSTRKAASIVGLGRNSVVDVTDQTMPVQFDLEALRTKMADKDKLSIVVVSCGEVNTGRFATTGESMKQIRGLCDEYGAWIHVDAGKFHEITSSLESE